MLRHSTVYVILISVCNGIYQYLALCVWLVMEAVEGGEDVGIVECITVCVWEMEKQTEENQDFFAVVCFLPPPPASGCSEYCMCLLYIEGTYWERKKSMIHRRFSEVWEMGVNEKRRQKKTRWFLSIYSASVFRRIRHQWSRCESPF